MNAEVKALSSHSISRLLAFYETLDATSLMRVMVQKEFKDKVALLSSFGADSAVLIHLMAQIAPEVPVLFLETGKHFPETLEYVEQLKSLLGLTNLKYIRPKAEFVDVHDAKGDMWSFQPNRCCWMRKVEPLKRALEEEGYHAIITGRKRHQTTNRKEMDRVELGEDGIFRINPIASWSKRDIADYMKQYALPQHPLVEKGYPSIGCAPCTHPVAAGADERSGRWAHTAAFPGAQKAECGIHVPEAATWDV